MVRKKSSRAASRCKVPIRDDQSDSDEESKINLEKRLDDFHGQVAEKIKQMEADKESFFNVIRNLYYMDQQSTPSSINKMLQTDFISQNNAGGKLSTIRNSIDNLIETAQSELTAKTRSKRKRAPIVAETPTEGLRRSTRNRTNNILRESQMENFQVPATANKGRGKKKDVVTPACRSIPPRSTFITPKFDIRTPLPPGTMRKARPGEMTVSLQGSPIVHSQVEDVLNGCDVENLDAESMKAFRLLQQKLALAK